MDFAEQAATHTCQITDAISMITLFLYITDLYSLTKGENPVFW